jgi:hypothetical protein
MGALSFFEESLLRLYPFRRGVCQLLTLRDVYVLSLTSKCLRRLMCPRVEKAQCVDVKLKKFVKDPSSFRLMLRDTKGALSGEFARSFFLGTNVCQVLDIVVVDPRFYSGAKMNRWVRYLRKREGYGSAHVTGSLAQRATQVFSCFRKSDGVTINIHSCFREKSEDARRAVLESAYATHMGCVLTWNKAYCVYPWALSECDTWVLSCFLTTRQRHELKQWLDKVGGSVDVSIHRRFLGRASEVDIRKCWVVPFSCAVRKLRRYVYLIGVVVFYVLWSDVCRR